MVSISDYSIINEDIKENTKIFIENSYKTNLIILLKECFDKEKDNKDIINLLSKILKLDDLQSEIINIIQSCSTVLDDKIEKLVLITNDLQKKINEINEKLKLFDNIKENDNKSINKGNDNKSINKEKNIIEEIKKNKITIY